MELFKVNILLKKRRKDTFFWVRVYGLGFMGYGISVPLKSDNIRIEVSYVNKNKKKKQKTEIVCEREYPYFL